MSSQFALCLRAENALRRCAVAIQAVAPGPLLVAYAICIVCLSLLTMTNPNQLCDVLLFPAFSKKSGGTLFSAFRGALCVVRGSEFLVAILSP